MTLFFPAVAGPFRQFVPTWLVPQSKEIIEPLYAGHTTFWTWERVAAWSIPVSVLDGVADGPGRDALGMERDSAPPLGGA